MGLAPVQRYDYHSAINGQPGRQNADARMTRTVLCESVWIFFFGTESYYGKRLMLGEMLGYVGWNWGEGGGAGCDMIHTFVARVC